MQSSNVEPGKNMRISAKDNTMVKLALAFHYDTCAKLLALIPSKKASLRYDIFKNKNILFGIQTIFMLTAVNIFISALR